MNLEPRNKVQHLALLSDTIESLPCQLSDQQVHGRVIAAPSSFTHSPSTWQQIPSYMVLPERGSLTQVIWFIALGSLDTPVPLSQRHRNNLSYWIESGSFCQFPLSSPPPSPLLFTNVSMTGWGVHLQELTASRHGRPIHQCSENESCPSSLHLPTMSDG